MRIDPHDLSIKVGHAVDFLCEDMKVKVALRFRGREMAHTEFGFQVIEKFVEEIAPYGHPDFEPKLVGRSINLMISPLPRNKRAKHPHQPEGGQGSGSETISNSHRPNTVAVHKPASAADADAEPTSAGFGNTPFDNLELDAKSSAGES